MSPNNDDSDSVSPDTDQNGDLDDVISDETVRQQGRSNSQPVTESNQTQSTAARVGDDIGEAGLADERAISVVDRMIDVDVEDDLETLQELREEAADYRQRVEHDTEEVLLEFPRVRELLTKSISAEQLPREVKRRRDAAGVVAFLADSEPERIGSAELISDICTVIEAERERAVATNEDVRGVGSASIITRRGLLNACGDLATVATDALAEHTETIEADLTANVPQVQARAMRALGKLADAGSTEPVSVIEEVLPLLTESSFLVRQNAVALLGDLTKHDMEPIRDSIEDVVSALVESRRAARLPDRDSSANALGENCIGLLSRIANGDPDRVAENDVLEQVAAELDSDLAGTRQQSACQILNKLSDEYPGAVADHVGTSRIERVAFSGRDELAQQGALACLGKLMIAGRYRLSDDQVPDLINNLAEGSEQIANLSEQILIAAAEDDPYVRNRIESLLDDEVPAARHRGVSALAKLADRDPGTVHAMVDENRLETLLEDDDHRVVVWALHLVGHLLSHDPETNPDGLFNRFDEIIATDDDNNVNIALKGISRISMEDPDRVLEAGVVDELPSIDEMDRERLESAGELLSVLADARPDATLDRINKDHILTVVRREDDDLPESVGQGLARLCGSSESLREQLLAMTGEVQEANRILAYAASTQEDVFDETTALLDGDTAEQSAALEIIGRVSKYDDNPVTVEPPLVADMLDMLDHTEESVGEAVAFAVVETVADDPTIADDIDLSARIADLLAHEDEEIVVRAGKLLRGIIVDAEFDITATDGFDDIVAVAEENRGEHTEHAKKVLALATSHSADFRSAMFTELQYNSDQRTQTAGKTLIRAAKLSPDTLAEPEYIERFLTVAEHTPTANAELALGALKILADEQPKELINAEVHSRMAAYLEREDTEVLRSALAVLASISRDQPAEVIEKRISSQLSRLLDHDDENVVGRAFHLATQMARIEPARVATDDFVKRAYEEISDKDRSHEWPLRFLAAVSEGVPERVVQPLPVVDLVETLIELPEPEEPLPTIRLVQNVTTAAPGDVLRTTDLEAVVEFYAHRERGEFEAQRVVHTHLLEDPSQTDAVLTHLGSVLDAETEIEIDEDEAGPAIAALSPTSLAKVVAQAQVGLKHLVPLALLHHSDDHRERIEALLSSNDRNVCAGAADSVGFLAESDPELASAFVPKLAALLDHRDIEVRQNAAEALALISSSDFEAVVDAGVHGRAIELLSTDPDPEVRKYLLRIVDQVVAEDTTLLDPRTVATRLCRLAAETQGEEFEHSALLRAGGRVVGTNENTIGALVDIVDDGDEEMGTAAGALLVSAMNQTEGVVERLIETIRTDQQRRTTAASFLAMIADFDPALVAERPVVDALADQLDHSEELRKYAIDYLLFVSNHENGFCNDPALLAELFAVAVDDPALRDGLFRVVNRVTEYDPVVVLDAGIVDDLIEVVTNLEEEERSPVVETLSRLAEVDRSTRLTVAEAALNHDPADGPFTLALGLAATDNSTVVTHISDVLDGTEDDSDIEQLALHVYRTAVEYDHESTSAGEAVEVAVAALEDEQPANRDAALRVLGHVGAGNPAQITNPTIIERIDSLLVADGDVTEAALRPFALAANKDPELVARLADVGRLVERFETVDEEERQLLGASLVRLYEHDPELRQLISGRFQEADISDPGSDTAQAKGEPDNEAASDVTLDDPLVETFVTIFREMPSVMDYLTSDAASPRDRLRSDAHAILKPLVAACPSTVNEWLSSTDLSEWLEGPSETREFALQTITKLAAERSVSALDEATVQQVFVLLGDSEEKIRKLAERVVLTALYDDTLARPLLIRSVAALLEDDDPNRQYRAARIVRHLEEDDSTESIVKAYDLIDVLFGLLSHDQTRIGTACGQTIGQLAASDEAVCDRVEALFDADEETLSYHACGIVSIIISASPDAVTKRGLHEHVVSMCDHENADVRSVAAEGLKNVSDTRPEVVADDATLSAIVRLLAEDAEDCHGDALWAAHNLIEYDSERFTTERLIDKLGGVVTEPETSEPATVALGYQILTTAFSVKPETVLDIVDLQAAIDAVGSDIKEVRRTAATFVDRVGQDAPESLAAVDGFARLTDLVIEADEEVLRTVIRLFVNVIELDSLAFDQVMSTLDSDTPEVQTLGLTVLGEVSWEDGVTVMDTGTFESIAAKLDHPNGPGRAAAYDLLNSALETNQNGVFDSTVVHTITEHIDPNDPDQIAAVLQLLTTMASDRPEMVTDTMAVDEVLPYLGHDNDRVAERACILLTEYFAHESVGMETLRSAFDREAVRLQLLGNAFAYAARRNPDLVGALSAFCTAEDPSLVEHGLGMLSVVAEEHPDTVAEEFDIDVLFSLLEEGNESARSYAISVVIEVLLTSSDAVQLCYNRLDREVDESPRLLELALTRAITRRPDRFDGLPSLLESEEPQTLLPVLNVLNRAESRSSEILIAGDHWQRISALATHDEREVRASAGKVLMELLSKPNLDIDITAAHETAESLLRSDGDDPIMVGAGALLAKYIANRDPVALFEGELPEVIIDRVSTLSGEATEMVLSELIEIIDANPALAIEYDMPSRTLPLLADGDDMSHIGWAQLSYRYFNENVTTYADTNELDQILDAFGSGTTESMAVAYQILRNFAISEPAALVDPDILRPLQSHLTSDERISRRRAADVLGILTDRSNETPMSIATAETIAALDEVVSEFTESDDGDDESTPDQGSEVPGIAGLDSLIRAIDEVPTLSVNAYLSLLDHDERRVRLYAAQVIEALAAVDSEQVRPVRGQIKTALRSETDVSQIRTILFRALRWIGSESTVTSLSGRSPARTPTLND